MTAVGVALCVGWSMRAEDVAGAPDSADLLWTGVASVLPLGVAGALLVDRRPDLPFGWLLALGAASQTVSIAVYVPSVLAVVEGNDSALPLWGMAVGGSFFFIPEAVKGFVNLRFPSGVLASRRARLLERAIIAGTTLAVLGGMLGSTSLAPDPDTGGPAIPRGLEHPLTGGTVVGDVADALIVFGPLTVLLGLIAGVGVVMRWRRAEGTERQQLQWRSAGVIFALVLFPAALSSDLGLIGRLDALALVLTLVVPVLRHQLWSIDALVRRSVAYAGVVVVLIGLYAVVAAIGAGFGSERTGAAAGAVVTAIVFAPLVQRAKALVDRLFYGDRGDPYRALSSLAQRLEAVAPPEVATTIVETVASSLRLPHVAVERPDGSVAAEQGSPGAGIERWPLTFEGASVGQLLASPRQGEDAFDDRDRVLLADVARQAGVAVHAAALTNDLLASRQRLVTAIEEERRRLRRDLHDGLGPVLTAVGLNLDAARAQLAPAPEVADELLVGAREATTHAIDEVRRVVYGLRPPALDDLGLIGALRAHVERIERNGDLRVTFEPSNLPPLPAAVEVAIYRTAVEALHNAGRHGRARSARVRLAVVEHHAVLEVHDDGSSSGPWVPGVGLAGMRERAEELGGTFTAGPGAAGGAVVTSRIPLLAEGT